MDKASMVKVSTPGHPDLTKPLGELETLLRKGMDDNRVDLVLLALDTKGEAKVTHRGVELAFKKV